MENKRPEIITAALVKYGNKFLLAKERITGKEVWIVPGGHVEFGESIEEAAIREIKEELDMDIKPGKILGFNQAIFAQYNYHTLIFFVSCTSQTDNFRIIDEGMLDAKFFSIEEIKKLDLIDSAKWLFDSYF